MGDARSWCLAAIAAVAVVGLPSTGRAQLFVAFDDWTDTCPTFGSGCDVVVQPGGSASSVSLEGSTECVFGQCLRARWEANESYVWMGPTDSLHWRAVYFEAQVRLPPEGVEIFPTTGDSIGLAKFEDSVTGLTYRFLLGPEDVTLTRYLLSTPRDTDELKFPLSTPSEFTRVAVLIDEVSDTQARVTLWVGDAMRAPAFLPHTSAGDTLPFGGFDTIFALGELQTSTVWARELYIDDVCFAPGGDARDGFCPMQIAGRPDTGVPDAGPDAGLDAGPDAGPDAAPDVGPDGAAADTATGPDRQATYRGVGGCACSPASGPIAPAAPLGALLALVAFWRARRRR